MGGALSIADGLRTATLKGAWNGYANALGFKAPLVCVLPGILMLFGGNHTWPFAAALVSTFTALGLAAYSLFRWCLRPSQAAAASVLMLATPLVTGLTHRFYVELLLLLLAVLTLNVLAGGAWSGLGRSVLLGFLVGLGTLCKTTFVPLLALLLAYSIVREVLRIGPRNLGQLGMLLLRVAAAATAAIATAGPWYWRNYAAVAHHAQIASGTDCCFYSNWLIANLSAGPSLWVAFAALAGAGILVVRLVRGTETLSSAQHWIWIMLLAVSTLAATAATPNKCTRFSATWLPAFCALAAYAFSAIRPVAPVVVAAVAILMPVHNSFALLPVQPVRFGDWILLDSSFPLNVPGWFDDNHPVDRRHFPLADAEAAVAADAVGRFTAGERAEARTTELGLFINHDYFMFLTAVRRHPVRFTWWPGTCADCPGAPDYIVTCRGCGSLYPGTHFFEHFPTIEEDLVSGRIPYELLRSFDGPAGSRVLVLAKKQRRPRQAAFNGSRPSPGG